MGCKYCEEFTWICTNPESPCRAEECPVPDAEGVCRFEDREEERYMLTPRGCAIVALKDAGLVMGIDDPRIDQFFDRFQALMCQCGYIQEENFDG